MGCTPPDYSRSDATLAAARGGPPEPSFEEEGHAVLQGFYATAAAGEIDRKDGINRVVGARCASRIDFTLA